MQQYAIPSNMEAGIGCSNKKYLENLMRHGLFYCEGPEFNNKEHIAPVNWEIKKVHDTEWICSESWSKQADWEGTKDLCDDKNFSVWMMMPLFENTYLLMVFTVLGSLPAELSNKLMFQRINQIILSIKLNLAPEAIKQKSD